MKTNKKTISPVIIVAAVVAIAIVVIAGVVYYISLPSTPVTTTAIKIGLFGPYSNPTGASSATETQLGMDLAIKEINANGGVNGRPLELVRYDTRLDTKEAIAVAHKLIEYDNVTVAVSGEFSAPTRAAAPIFSQAKVPLLVSYANEPKITVEGGEYVFRNTEIADVCAASSAWWDIKKLNHTKSALITMNLAVGLSQANGWKSMYAELGGEVVLEVTYTSGETDFTPYLTQLKQANPESIYIAGYDWVQIMKQAAELGMTGGNITWWNWHSTYNYDAFTVGGRETDGVYAHCNWVKEIPADIAPDMATWMNWALTNIGQTPVVPGFLSVYVIGGYECVYILKDAMDAAMDATGAITGENIKNALSDPNFVSIGRAGWHRTTKFNAYRETVRPMAMIRLDYNKTDPMKSTFTFLGIQEVDPDHPGNLDSSVWMPLYT